MDGDKRPEWLPADWEVGERKRCGKRRKWYVEPKNGLKFFSRPEVLRYLNEDVKTRKKQREAERDKVTTESAVSVSLPAGWIKEVRRRRVSGKKDTAYIEPVTGREFRSMSSVLRHLKAKHEDEDHIGAEGDNSKSSPTEAEGKILIDNKGDQEFAEGKTGVSERSPLDNGAENLISLKEPQDISVEGDFKETCIACPVEPPKEEESGLDKSGKTPAAGSSSEMPPGDFFNVPWFPAAYKLIKDEIPVETYVKQTSKSLSVPT